MKIDNILIQRSPVHDKGVFALHIEMNGCTFSGYFDSFPGFLVAVSDAAKYFMVRMGKISNEQARATREIQDVKPGHGGNHAFTEKLRRH